MSLRENLGSSSEDRAQWITQRLQGGTPTAETGSTDYEERIVSLEEMVFGELKSLLGPESNLTQLLESMNNELETAVNSLDDRVSELEETAVEQEATPSGLSEEIRQLAQLQEATSRRVAVLAQFMERCLPFIQGMEEAFASEES